MYFSCSVFVWFSLLHLMGFFKGNNAIQDSEVKVDFDIFLIIFRFLVLPKKKLDSIFSPKKSLGI